MGVEVRRQRAEAVAEEWQGRLRAPPRPRAEVHHVGGRLGLVVGVRRDARGRARLLVRFVEGKLVHRHEQRRLCYPRELRAQVVLLDAREGRVARDGRLELAGEELLDDEGRRDLVRRGAGGGGGSGEAGVGAGVGEGGAGAPGRLLGAVSTCSGRTSGSSSKGAEAPGAT